MKEKAATSFDMDVIKHVRQVKLLLARACYLLTKLPLLFLDEHE